MATATFKKDPLREKLPAPIRGLVDFFVPDEPESIIPTPPVFGAAAKPGKSALRELLEIIRSGAKKDPAKIFLAEKVTGPRIGPTPELKIPEGFHMGSGDPRIIRAPALVEKSKKEAEFYSQFGKKTRGPEQFKPESIRSLEELGSQTFREPGVRVPPPPVGKPGVGGRISAKMRAKLNEDQVREIRNLPKSQSSYTDAAKKYGVSDSTIRAIVNRDSYGWVK